MFWLVKIWQVSSWGKFMQLLETCLLISWSWQSFVSSCDVLNCLFYLTYKMKYSCYQDCSVIHADLFIALFVDKCTAFQSHWKSHFGWHRFQKWAYSLALAWGVRGLKRLKRFWNTNDDLQKQHLDWQAWAIIVFDVFFLSVSWSRAYGLCGLSLYTSNDPDDLTYNTIVSGLKSL